jgi:serine O-acetyltransferase
MSSIGTSKPPSFSELVFSDYARYRPGRATWLHVLARCLTNPGLLASIILRAQQCLFRAGHVRAAMMCRGAGIILVGADLGPGMQVGTGLLMPHPVGVNIGYGLRIGNNVSLAAGATAAARYYDRDDEDQQFATICDNAVIGAHAVLVGGVRIGENAVVGANSVVLSDVPDNTTVMGNPARRVGVRPSVGGPVDEQAAQADQPSANLSPQSTSGEQTAQ